MEGTQERALRARMRARPTVMHLDADAFFAAVEQRDKPSLKGRPVLVGGAGPRGVVATASYEARRAGARSAMPMSTARNFVPDAYVLVPRFEAYSAYSALIMGVLRDLSPAVQPLSIDEAFVDLDAGDSPCPDPVAAGQDARARIRSLTGLPVSVGLGRSKLVAKLASDAAKPDGLRLVTSAEEDDFLLPLSVRALWGVGPASATALERVGVRTVADLRRQPLDTLVMMLGESAGANLFRVARGLDDRAVQESAERKSAGAERTFTTDLHGRGAVGAALDPVADAALRRLERHGGAARTVVVKVRYADFTTVTRSVSLPQPVADRAVLREAAHRALALTESGEPVRLLGVSFHGLSEHAQMMLPLPGGPEDDHAVLVEPQDVSGPVFPVPLTEGRLAPGLDVEHVEHGRGWVVRAGDGRVSVRFETALTGPGRQRNFDVDTPDLALVAPMGPVAAP